MPEILKNVQPGQKVFIDDGKISAVVRQSSPPSVSSSDTEYLELEIISPIRYNGKNQTAKRIKFPRF
jgi:pyruvate kinase